MAVVLLSALLFAGPLSSEPAEALPKPERKLVRFINKARANHGLKKLKVGSFITKKAEKHSVSMSKASAVFHSTYRFRYGENVGVESSVWKMHRAFMNSPVHKSNVLYPSYRRVGVGVVRTGSWVWVTEIFRT